MADYGDAYIPRFDPPVNIAQRFPKSFCKLLVSELASSAGVESGVFGSGGFTKVDSYHRSSAAIMPTTETRLDAELLMTTAVDLFSVSVLAKRATLAEPIQFLKYDSKKQGHFLAHTDNAYYDGHGVFQYTSPQRMLTCLVYLNEDYEGGELIFNTVRDDSGHVIKLKPKTGELIIFPSDIRFMHEVLNVTMGQRYSIVGWYRLK